MSTLTYAVSSCGIFHQKEPGIAVLPSPRPPSARGAPCLSTVPGATIKPGEEKNSLTMIYHEENRRRVYSIFAPNKMTRHFFRAGSGIRHAYVHCHCPCPCGKKDCGARDISEACLLREYLYIRNRTWCSGHPRSVFICRSVIKMSPLILP